MSLQQKQFFPVNLNDSTHCKQLLFLLNDYMEDEMGISQPMPKNLGPKIIVGLKKHPAYLGFFVCMNHEYAALANCNVNYSTWSAKFLINIHDFIVSPKFRKQGIGQFLLKEIEKFALEKGYGKINLEVRCNNIKAQKLYKKEGFTDCKPPMYFWQKQL